ncbi:MAG TPA: hypothetical protein VK666_24805 [Chryseolinea sp.]|nr:hypothetical protein [Chryseolinea sp.]
MKHYECYSKHKTNYRATINPVFYKRNWWQIVLLTLIAVLVEPLIMYKHIRTVPFSFAFYLQLLEYSVLVAVPFISFLLWLNWREAIKRSRGYSWVGKFEVTNKRSSFLSCYLLLAPGNSKLKVGRTLFDKTHIGNFILIRRDSLGKIEEVRKLNNLSSRLTRIRTNDPGLPK